LLFCGLGLGCVGCGGWTVLVLWFVGGVGDGSRGWILGLCCMVVGVLCGFWGGFGVCCGVFVFFWGWFVGGFCFVIW